VSAKVKAAALAVVLVAAVSAAATPLRLADSGKAASAPDAAPSTRAEAPPKPAPETKKTDVAMLNADLGPDDMALRFYASRNNTARVTTEISRLQRLYAGYKPPADLYSQPLDGGVDEGPMWELYAADRLDELQAQIEKKQQETPGWKPSADLTQKIKRKMFRAKVTGFWQSGHWQDLVDFIKTEDVKAEDADVDVLWTIAEAYARTRQTVDAVALYKSVLTTSKDRAIRIATVQKAMASLRMTNVEQLLAAIPDAATDFQPIAIDIARARMAAFLRDERVEEVTPAEVQKVEAAARDSHEAGQLGLVAWYYFKRRDLTNALEWFKAAIQNGGDHTIAHGLAHTLLALDLRREAEEVAFAWRDPAANNVILFIDLLEHELAGEVPSYVEPARLARYGMVTMEVASGEGAQALAWYAFNSCQFDVAQFWFERAVAWYPRESSVQGYALTMSRLKKEKGLYELANRYDGLYPKLIEILFPDGLYHTPSPCDRKDAAKLHGLAQRFPALVVPGPALYLPPGTPSYYAPPKPLPTALDERHAAEYAQIDRVLKRLKGKFPVPVAVENPLRVRPVSMNGHRATGAAAAQAPETPLIREAARPQPLVARRVLGVGAMPYEQYGFSLLAGWNGAETATWPPASQQLPPRGTQWAEQKIEPSPAGLDAFDPRLAPPRGGPQTPTIGLPPLQPAGQGQAQYAPQQYAPQNALGLASSRAFPGAPPGLSPGSPRAAGGHRIVPLP
jgi:tetratricopeptide (TPR) repeat protein